MDVCEALPEGHQETEAAGAGDPEGARGTTGSPDGVRARSSSRRCQTEGSALARRVRRITDIVGMAPLVTGYFSYLSMDLLVEVLGSLRVRELSRCACTSKWMRTMATRDRFWIAAATRAQIDWTSIISTAEPHTLHTKLGPRLLKYEANETMPLLLSWSEEDGDEVQGDQFEKLSVTIDQQTPLSTVTEPFIEQVLGTDEQEHLTPLGHRVRAQPREVGIYQGKPHARGCGWPEVQAVNPHRTAWHYQLEAGATLYFHEIHRGD